MYNGSFSEKELDVPDSKHYRAIVKSSVSSSSKIVLDEGALMTSVRTRCAYVHVPNRRLVCRALLLICMAFLHMRGALLLQICRALFSICRRALWRYRL